MVTYSLLGHGGRMKPGEDRGLMTRMIRWISQQKLFTQKTSTISETEVRLSWIKDRQTGKPKSRILAFGRDGRKNRSHTEKSM
jgi:hypothetical protein